MLEEIKIVYFVGCRSDDDFFLEAEEFLHISSAVEQCCADICIIVPAQEYFGVYKSSITVNTAFFVTVSLHFALLSASSHFIRYLQGTENVSRAAHHEAPENFKW